MAATDRFRNWFITSLVYDIDSTDTTMIINKNIDVSQGRLIIDPFGENKEIIAFTNPIPVTGGTQLTIVRADDNSTAHAHYGDTIVVMNVTAGDLNDLYAEWAAALADITTAISDANTATSNANTATTNANNAANATRITQGTSAPTGGYDGNFYFKTDTQDFYQKISGTWTIIANLKGATGTSMFYGSGAPSSGLGNNGDVYWRTDTAQMYGKSGGSWSVQTTISNSDVNAIKKDGSATVSADIPFNAHKLTGVADPASAQDAATKNYVDGKVASIYYGVGSGTFLTYATTGWQTLTGAPTITFTLTKTSYVEIEGVIPVQNNTSSATDYNCRIWRASTSTQYGVIGVMTAPSAQWGAGALRAFYSGTLSAGTYTLVVQTQQSSTNSSTWNLVSDRSFINARVYN